MNTATLTVTARQEKGKKSRRQGFIPAVIYGQGTKNMSVKFPQSHLIRVINQSGQRAKVNLVMDNEKKIGIIKAVDIHPITTEIQHVDIQLVETGETVNWEIPIIFSGRENLEAKRLLLQVDLPQIEVTGKVDSIPDTIVVDVRNKQANDTITIKDLELNPEIRVAKSADTVLAIVKYA